MSPSSWLLPSVTATALGTTVLAVAFWHLYLIEHKRFIGLWAWGWALYAARQAAMVFIVSGHNLPALVALEHSLSITSSVFILWGTYSFLGRQRLPRTFLVLALGAVLWAWAGVHTGLPFISLTLPLYAFSGAAYIWTGLIWHTGLKRGGLGKHAVAFSFVLWGLHKLDYPFLRSVEWFAPWGYIMATVLSLVTAIGMMLTYYRINRDDYRRVAAELEEKRETFRALVEFTDAVHWEYSVLEDRFTYVSPQAAHITGYGPERWSDLIFWSNMIHPEDREGAVSYRTGMAGERKDHELAYRIIAASGEVRWLRDIVKVIAEGDKPVKLVGVMFDITEQKAVESHLRQYEKVVSAANDRMAFIDRDYRFVIANEAYAAAVGLEQDEVVGRPVREVLGEENFRKVRPHIERCLAGSVADFEGWFHTRALGDQYLDVKYFPHREASGPVLGFAVVTRDMTEHKRFDEHVENSLREKEVLLREIHHRVKNNMQVIQSLLSLQAAYISDPRALELYRDSESRIRSMALVHEKLYQSRDFAHINARDYLQSLSASIRNSFGSRAVNVSLNLQASDLYLEPDVLVPCGLIVNELLTNSYKHAFGERGGTITLEFTEAEGESLRLRVSDDGVGLNGQAESLKFKGLGLKLVQTLARQIEGEVQLDKGRGTCFTILFPLKIQYSGRV